MMWWCAPDRTCSSLLLEQNFGWMLLSQTSKKQNKWLKSWLSDIFFDNTILIYWWITVPYWTFVSNCFVNKTNNKLPRRQQVPTWWRSASAGSFQELRWTALHWWMGLVTMHSQHWLHWRRGFLFMALVICCQNPIHILCLELVGITPIQQQWMQHRKLYPKDVHNPQQSMSQARFQTHAVYAQVGLGLCHLKTSCDRNL